MNSEKITRTITVFCFFCLFGVVHAQEYRPNFETDECPYFMQRAADEVDASIACGWLHVPENRDHPDDRLMLDLFVVRIESIEPNDNAPFVYLEGGPGGAASALFTELLEWEVRQSYDLILIDQRGTGLSYPSLNCPEMDESSEMEAIKACRDRLIDEGIDLNAYTSADNAHDIHDLLVALDIPEANLFGSSYGVRLGLTVIRDFPERIRTLTIDAVYPPQVDSLASEAFFGNQAFERLLSDCAADANCNRVYPNLRQSLHTAIDNMNDNPPEIYDYELGAYIELTGDDFVEYLFSEFYDTDILPFLPALIDAYGAGDYEYNPELESYERELDAAILAGDIEPDEYDIMAMEYLHIDNVNDLYAYYDSISDSEFNNLVSEIEEYAYLLPFQDYLGYETVAETADYLYDLDDESYYELEADVLGVYDDDSEGMHFSVECAEEVTFHDMDRILERASDLSPIMDVLTESALETFDECDRWGVEASEAIENDPVISDIPTLLFSGLYDPVTPYQWGEDTQSYLSNSVHFIFPNVGHGALDTQACASEILLAFLDDPTQTPDGSCVDELSSPAFYIRP